MRSKLSERLKVTMYTLDTDHSSATDVAWVDCSGYRSFAVGVIATALTGNGLDAAGALRILGNSESDGSGFDVVLATHATVTPDAVGDWLWLEVDLSDLAENAPNVRYVSANLNSANALDDHTVVYMLGDPRYAKAGLSADVIS
ncbi:MAG: hypothetical protein ACYTHJ_02575 [Planctomycetota bacterium]|jgi:hypothetical protein